MSRTGVKTNSLKQPKEEVNVKYMHKPPSIEPNYGGQKRTILPKSKVSRVLLYDNATQDHMLDIKLAHIAIEKERQCRLINLHKRSFSSRMMKKQHMKQVLAAGNKAKLNKTAQTSRPDDSSSRRLPPIPTQRPPSVITPASARPASVSDPENVNVNENVNEAVNANVNEASETETTNVKSAGSLEGIKLPAIDDDKRHVIFKVRDKTGNTKVYHTVDESGMVEDLIPMHNFYPKLVDDPRFRSLQNLLVPMLSETEAW